MAIHTVNGYSKAFSDLFDLLQWAREQYKAEVLGDLKDAEKFKIRCEVYGDYHERIKVCAIERRSGRATGLPQWDVRVFDWA